MDSKQYGPWAVIAGGSEGVGSSFAEKLATSGINLVLVARRAEPLEEVAHSVQAKSGVDVRTLPLDLTASDMLDRLRRVTDDLEVGTLIYNAGVARMHKPFLDDAVENALNVAALNVTGQLLLTHHFGIGMRARRRGGILLVGSVAGVAGSTNVAAYSGSKAFSHCFAEALWYELRPHNVHVLGLIIGLTRTPTMLRTVGDLSGYPHAIAEPETVAQEGLDHLADGPIHVVSAIDARVHALRTARRAEAVEMMSAATNNLNAQR